MSIADTLIKQILADSKWLKPAPLSGDDQFPEEPLLSTDFFVDAIELDEFRDREPDSFDEPHQLEVEPRALLGSYHHMHSPGVITLYRNNIEAYWRSLLSHAYKQFPFISRKDAERVLHLLAHSVYEHERFHYMCDFCRKLFGSSFDRWHEEALAVAREWHLLKAQQQNGNSTFSRIHPTLSRVIVRDMFAHTSRGYRDWSLFANPDTFIFAVRDYVHPGAAQLFAATNFDFGTWVLNHIGTDSNIAWTEQII